MAYDRYDSERERGWRGSERDHRDMRDHRDPRGERGERGWFERAGDEISSWFGGDDDRERRDPRSHRDDRDYRREQSGRDERYVYGDWGSMSSDSRDRDRGYGRSDRDYRMERERGPSRDRGAMSGGYRPMTGDYGRSSGGFDRSRSESPWGRDDYRSTSYAGSARDQDPHYRSMRQQHMDELDRDYDDYHRERQERFSSDFGSWRKARQEKRGMLRDAREHMDVVGNDGERVGKIDRVAGDKIILTKSDSEDGRHHSIPCSMVDRIEGDRVMLDCAAADAKKRWDDEDRNRALFEREDQGSEGPHALDRSFSGTYR